ncbi:MAG: STT3 domain-containing protein [Nitrososphaerales archaeon]
MTDRVSMLKDAVKSIHRPTVSSKTVLLLLALVAIFSVALFLRIYPSKYGYYLHEYDPFFDYYATNRLVEGFKEKGLAGFAEYFTWRDYSTWFPEGRDVASSSQVGLHFAGATLYLIATSIFNISITLYDFLVILPVYIGAFTTLIMFLLVKRFAGSGGGLLASLLFATSPPLLQRGSLGWFKSEPLALFLALSAVYLYLTIYDSKVKLSSLIWRASLAGILLGYANTCWGGAQYFGIVFGLFLIIASFMKFDLEKNAYAGGLLVSFTLVFSSIFPRPGAAFILNPIGLLLIVGYLFSLIAYRLESVQEKMFSRNVLKAVFSLLVVSLLVVSFGAVSAVSARYYTVIYPFQRTADPLIESVAEHFVPTHIEYFRAYGVLIFLALFGVYVAFRRRSPESIFALILGISGVYIASSFSRLMVYSTLALVTLGAIGLVELSSSILKSSKVVGKKAYLREIRSDVKIAYSILLIGLLTIPMVYPVGSSWRDIADQPVSIANAGTGYKIELSDWREALAWIRDNTPEDAVIISWWDYGYWITVMGNRTTLADNATINSTKIAQIGRLFMSNESQAASILKSLLRDPKEPDRLRPGYIVAFVAGQRLSSQGFEYYMLGGGGDESKKQWFIRIGGLNMTQFLYEDEFTPKPYFWENTILGKMWPFEFVQFVDRSGRFQGSEYKPGYIALYTKQLKYTDDDGLLKLVFKSSSLDNPSAEGVFAAVLIYKVLM